MLRHKAQIYWGRRRWRISKTLSRFSVCSSSPVCRKFSNASMLNKAKLNPKGAGWSILNRCYVKVCTHHHPKYACYLKSRRRESRGIVPCRVVSCPLMVARCPFFDCYGLHDSTVHWNWWPRATKNSVDIGARLRLWSIIKSGVAGVRGRVSPVKSDAMDPHWGLPRRCKN